MHNLHLDSLAMSANFQVVFESCLSFVIGGDTFTCQGLEESSYAIWLPQSGKLLDLSGLRMTSHNFALDPLFSAHLH